MILKLLEERILKDGKALTKHILKVDSFLNHQVDPNLMEEIGKDFALHFKNKGITKVATIESSGIAPALMTANIMDVPLVIFKKQTSKTLVSHLYQTPVTSFTKGITYDLSVSKDYIQKDDTILIIDDFLANGEAANGAIRLVEMGNAKVAGIGIVIEKSFQPGRKKLEDLGFEVYSLARITKLDTGLIEFKKDIP